MRENEKKYLPDEELAILAANGDDESMALLISKVTPIAKAKAFNFKSARVPEDDLAQEGMLGFLEAVKSFDVSKGVPFKAYAEACISNRIVSAVRTSYNNKNSALSNALSFEDERVGLNDSKSDPAVILSQKDETEYLTRLLESGLSDFEKQVINLHLKSKSYAQISAALGCSEKAVDNALQRVKKKMRAKLSNNTL